MKNLNDSEKYCGICFANDISNPELMFILEEDPTNETAIMVCENCQNILIDQQD